MTNPFEDPDTSYFVLVNDEGQYSLWPVFTDVPDGWHVVFGQARRQDCLSFIEEFWRDMRPKSLIEAMGNNSPLLLGRQAGNDQGAGHDWN